MTGGEGWNSPLEERERKRESVCDRDREIDR
jgi:hypothetical protein